MTNNSSEPISRSSKVDKLGKRKLKSDDFNDDTNTKKKSNRSNECNESNTRIKSRSNNQAQGRKMTLVKFLKERAVDDSGEITHTSMSKSSSYPTGSYNIKHSDMDEFYKLYNKAVFDKKDKVFLVERHEDTGPLVVDIDLKYNKSTKRQFKDSHIKQVVKYYTDEIAEVFEIQDPEDTLTAFVTCRDEPYIVEKNGKEEIKDGFHIYFPNVVSTPKLQYQIRKNVIKRMREDKFADGFRLAEKRLEIIVDEKIIHKTGILLLGSRKDIRTEAYHLHRVYFGLDQQEEDIESYKENGSLARTLSIREKSNLTPIKKKYTCIEQQGTGNGTGIRYSTESGQEISEQTIMNSEDVSNVANLAQMLSVERLTDYNTWIYVGLCLHNIGNQLNSGDEMLELWDEISQKADNYKAGECSKKWHSFDSGTHREKKYNIRSLHRWAKEDNPEKFNEYMASDIRNILEKSFDGQDFDIAQVVHAIYKYRFACVPLKSGGAQWYEFKNHRWNERAGAQNLRYLISMEISDYYNQLVVHYNMEAENSDDNEVEYNMERAKRYATISQQCRNTTFKEKVVKSCIEIFSQDTLGGSFIEKLDQNPYLICFENGVYDLKERRFRDGEPDDYVSLTTKINYRPMSKDNPRFKPMIDFLRKVLPLNDVRHYALKVLASCLVGDCSDQLFHFLTGSGGNGKSKLMFLMKEALGEYACTLPIGMLTQKRTTYTNANPSLLKARGRRMATFDETEEGDKINLGVFKSITGGDPIEARGLFKDPIEFQFQATLFLICNDMPQVPPVGKSMWRRIRVIDFIAEFVGKDEMDGSSKYQYLKDTKLDEKLREWAETFMSYLIDHYYPIYDEENVVENPPDEVMKACNEYRKENDFNDEFLSSAVERTGDDNDIVEITKLLSLLKDWCEVNHAGTKRIRRDDFKKYLQGRYGKKQVNEKFVTGIRLVEGADAESDSDDEGTESVFNPLRTEKKNNTISNKKEKKSEKSMRTENSDKLGKSERVEKPEKKDRDVKPEKTNKKVKETDKKTKAKKQRPHMDMDNISDSESESSIRMGVKRKSKSKSKKSIEIIM